MVTLRDKCRFLDKLRDKGVQYDTALPIDWIDEVMEKTGMYPAGVVWLYDDNGILGTKCAIFGRPYAVTMFGYWVLKLYYNTLRREVRGG